MVWEKLQNYTEAQGYDLVLPTLLDMDWHFGVPIWLDASLSTRVEYSWRPLEWPGSPALGRGPGIDPTVLADLVGDEPTR